MVHRIQTLQYSPILGCSSFWQWDIKYTFSGFSFPREVDDTGKPEKKKSFIISPKNEIIQFDPNCFKKLTNKSMFEGSDVRTVNVHFVVRFSLVSQVH